MMNLFSSIFNEIIVLEVEANGGAISAKTSTAKCSSRDSTIAIQEIDKDKFDQVKKKNRIAMLFVTGSDVGSKEYNDYESDATKKITRNDNLLWTIHEENNHTLIDFIRKSSLESIVNELESKGFYIADITVSRNSGIDARTRLQLFFEKKLILDRVKKSREFRALFFDNIFDMIKLPVLLLFFVLLFINYIAFANIREKYETSETAYNIQLQKNKLAAEHGEKANRLFDEYNKIQSYPLALMSDRVASYLSKDTRLISMTFFPRNNDNARGKSASNTNNLIIIKGKAGIPGTVLLFAQYLQEDKLFDKVEIININNLQNTGLYDFEIHVML